MTDQTNLHERIWFKPQIEGKPKESWIVDESLEVAVPMHTFDSLQE
jgi:hypothetical protein